MIMAGTFTHGIMDFHMEIKVNPLAVFLHFPYWKKENFEEMGIEPAEQQRVLAAIQEFWAHDFPQIELPG